MRQLNTLLGLLCGIAFLSLAARLWFRDEKRKPVMMLSAILIQLFCITS